MRKIKYFALAVALILGISKCSDAQQTLNGARGFPATNDTSTGTTLNGTAVVGATGAINATTSQTTIPTYVVINGAGNSGTATLGNMGLAPCTMDSTIASGGTWDYVVNSPTVNKECHAQSAAPAAGTWIIGYLYSSSTTSGQTSIIQINGYVFGGLTGSSVLVNGSLIASPNFNSMSPTADAGFTAITWKVSGSNVIAEFPTEFYQSVEVNGVGVTQRPILNLIPGSSMSINCVDNSGNGSTDCTYTSTGGSGGANTSLSNLSSVALNTSLLPGAVNTVSLGSNALPFVTAYFGTVANESASFATNLLTGNVTITIPNASGTLMYTATALACGQMPALTGDTTSSAATCATSTVKVNGVSYPASPSTNTVPVVTSPNTITYETVPNGALANASVNFNGQSVALGASGNVNVGAASGSLAINNGNGSAITGLAAPGADYLVTATAAATWAAEQINAGASCGDSTHAVSYSTTTHTFGCQSLSLTAITVQTNSSNNGSQSLLNFENGSSVNGIAVNASNPSGGIEQFSISGTLTATGGGTGLSNPTAHDLLIAEGSGNFALLSCGANTALLGQGSSADPTCGAIPNAVLANSSITINAPSFMAGWGSVSLGGSLSPSWSTESAGLVFANCTGSTAAPNFCALTTAMLPAIFQTNSTNNATATSLNMQAGSGLGLTITPTNTGTNVETFVPSGLLNATGGGTGVSNPTAHAILVAEGSSAFSTVCTPPSVNGSYVVFYNVSGGAAVDPTCALMGVPVDASNPASLLYSDRASYINWTSGATLTLPAATGNLASNLPFVIQNNTSGTLALTPTTPNNIDGGTAQAASSVPAHFAALVYQDNGPNWWTIKVPTFALFPLANSELANSSVTVNVTGCLTGGGTVSLGGSITIGASSCGGGGTGQVDYPVVPPSPNKVYGLSTTAAATVANTATATSIVGTSFYGSNQIAAGAMLPNQPGAKTLKFHASGVMGTASSAPTLTVTVLLGGNTLSSITVPVTASLSSDQWEMDYYVTVTGIGSAEVGGCVRFIGTAGALLAGCASNQNVTGLNFAANQTFDVQATWSAASASNTITSNEAVLSQEQGL